MQHARVLNWKLETPSGRPLPAVRPHLSVERRRSRLQLQGAHVGFS